MELDSKKIFITGAGGFIGSHLVELCLSKGYKVTAFVHYNSRNDWGWLENVSIKDNLEIVSGDVRDYDLINKSLKGCNTVFHLAALIGIPYSYVSPLAYLRTNIEGTYNILEASKSLGLQNIIITSTSETYGTAQYVPIDEQHPLIGQSPYSATKIAADQLGLSYHLSFGLPVKIVRPFNTFGPRQSGRAIIPTIITQIMSGKTEIRLGSLHPTRDFTYVKDTVEAFVKIAESENLFGEVVNIGMNEEVSMKELASTIASLMNKDVEIVSDEKRLRPANSEVERLCCDNTKLKSNTTWTPRYDFKSGLLETIGWLEKNVHIYKTDVYNV